MDFTGTRVLQDDLPAAEARALLGPRRILGVSVKTPEQAVAAAAAGADYLGAGAGGQGRLYPGAMSAQPWVFQYVAHSHACADWWPLIQPSAHGTMLHCAQQQHCSIGTTEA